MDNKRTLARGYVYLQAPSAKVMKTWLTRDSNLETTKTTSTMMKMKITTTTTAASLVYKAHCWRNNGPFTGITHFGRR